MCRQGVGWRVEVVLYAYGRVKVLRLELGDKKLLAETIRQEGLRFAASVVDSTRLTQPALL